MKRDSCCPSMGNLKWRGVEVHESKKVCLGWVLNDQALVAVALVLCQTVAGFYYVGTAVALENGANSTVLSFYRNLIALVVLAPIAFFWEFRRENRVTFSPGVLSYVAVLGFVGIFGSNFLLFKGIQNTTAAFAAGLQPVAPVTTAFISVLFGVERILLHRHDGQAKLAGIISCLTGAFLMTFWHGAAIYPRNHSMAKASSHCMGKTLQESILILPENTDASTGSTNTWGLSQWQVGILYLCGNSMATGAFLNMQSPLLKTFPAPFTVLSFAYLFGTTFMGVFCFHSVSNISAYSLGFDSNTAIIFYNGIIGSALYFFLTSWTLTRVCPIYVASFNILQPPVTAFFSVLFLGGTAYVANVLGSLLIIMGLTLTCWALTYEETLTKCAFDLPSTRPRPDESSGAEVNDFSDSGRVDGLMEPLLQKIHKSGARDVWWEPPILENFRSKSAYIGPAFSGLAFKIWSKKLSPDLV